MVLLASLLCSACRVGPQYQRPTAPVPVALKELKDNDQWKMATPSDGLIKGKWWEIFGDPELNRLEELVNVNNQNVKQAEAQFRQARALVAANRANYYRRLVPPRDRPNRRRKQCRPSYWNQSEFFPTSHRVLGAGFLGKGSLVGRERGR